MKVLYHTDKEVIHDLNDGRLYTFPPQEPVEVEDDYIAKRILEHLWYYGLVEVPTVRTRSGVAFDLESAQASADAALKAADKKMLQQYIDIQLEDRIRKNHVPLPPTGRHKYVIDKYKVDLTKYGIKLIGPDNLDSVSTLDPPMSPDVRILMSENKELKDRLDRIMGLIDNGELVANRQTRPVAPTELTIETTDPEGEDSSLPTVGAGVDLEEGWDQAAQVDEPVPSPLKKSKKNT